MKLRFTLSEVGKDLSCNRVMSVATVPVTFVSLFFVGIAGLSQMQVMHMKSERYDKIKVSTYIYAVNNDNPSCNSSEANTEQISQARAKLKSPEMQPYAKEVYEESKGEAYENFKRLYGDSTIGQWISADVMQVSLRVKFVDPGQYSIIKEKFSGVTRMFEVKDQREIIEPLFKVIDVIRLFALGLGAVTVIAAILLISTTIRSSAISRKQETQIMRYVGASNLFIRAPFMIEGMLATVTGALSTVISLFAFVVFLMQGWLQPTFQWTRLIGVREVWIIALLLILAAVLLALIVSAVSLAKYTKV